MAQACFNTCLANSFSEVPNTTLARQRWSPPPPRSPAPRRRRPVTPTLAQRAPWPPKGPRALDLVGATLVALRWNKRKLPVSWARATKSTGRKKNRPKPSAFFGSRASNGDTPNFGHAEIMLKQSLGCSSACFSTPSSLEIEQHVCF